MVKKIINKNKIGKKGFSIIELIVSIGLFTVVTLVAVGALLSIVGVNRKAQSFASVMNNLNFAVESMSKLMRVGTNYHCGPGGDIGSPRDCSSPSSYIAFERAGGDENNSNDQIIYRLNGTQIEKSINGGATFVGVTAPEVKITEDIGLRFYVAGSEASDGKQPKIIIIVRGTMGLSEKIKTDFNLQTTVSQRQADN